MKRIITLTDLEIRYVTHLAQKIQEAPKTLIQNSAKDNFSAQCSYLKRFKALLIYAMIVLSNITVSAKRIEVTVPNYGELKTVLEDKETDADSLIVHGQIDYSDIDTACKLSDLGKLVYLDLKDCKIRDYAIPNNAFSPTAENVSFKEIVLPDSVIGIGEYAFANLKSLERINMPKLLKKLGKGVFSGCTRLHADPLEIPEDVEQIPIQCFMDCSSIKQIIVPSGIKTIGAASFIRSGLESINLPEGLDSIGDGAFENTNLASIEIPSTIKKLDSYIFSGCLKLKSIKVSEGVTFIPSNFASNNVQLERVEIPSTVTSIANNAFTGCISLKSINLNEGLKTIEDEAFWNCSLETLVLPSTLEYLGIDAIGYCTNLKELYSKAIIPPKGDENQRAFKGTDNSIPVYIPIGAYESYVYSPYWKYFSLFVELEADKYPSSGNEIVLNDGNNIKVYSSMSKLIISTNDEQNGMLKYQIYQIDGRTVGAGSIRGNYTEISLPKGIYLVTVGSEKFKVKI
jgi:hypothetical protein